MRRGALQVVAGAVLFGLIPVCLLYCGGLSLPGVALGRAFFAAGFSALLLLFRSESFRISLRQAFHYFVWSALLAGAILCYFASIRLSGMSVSGALLGLHPVFVILFARMIFGEKISLLTWISCLLALPGIYLVASPGAAVFSAAGAAFSLLSAALLGLNFTYHLRFLKEENPYRLVFFQNLMQIPMLLPFFLADPGELSAGTILPLAILGILCSGIAYLLIYSGSRYIRKQLIGIFQVIENIVPALAGVLLFREQVSAAAISGIACILLAAVLAGWKKDDKPVFQA